MALWRKRSRTARDLWGVALSSMTTGLVANTWLPEWWITAVSRMSCWYRSRFRLPCTVIASMKHPPYNYRLPHQMDGPPWCAPMAVFACPKTFARPSTMCYRNRLSSEKWTLHRDEIFQSRRWISHIKRAALYTRVNKGRLTGLLALWPVVKKICDGSYWNRSDWKPLCLEDYCCQMDIV